MSTKKQWRVMDYLPRKFVTPVTGILSLVIGISGVMLFFHIEDALVKSVHEWLGMAFALIMVVHLVLNWSAFKKHFQKPMAWITTGMVAAVSAAFIITSAANPGGSPMHQVIHSIETTAITDLAPVFKVSESEMVQTLAKAGVEIKTGQETIEQLALKNGVDPRKLVVTLVTSSDIDDEDKL